MTDLEDFGHLEACDEGRSMEGSGELSENEKDYIQEVLPLEDPELLVARVDELAGRYPPQAVDSNPEVAEMLIPAMDYLDSRYLEAPNDFEQAEMLSDSMVGIEGVEYDSWREMSLEERGAVLQEIENRAAEIEHRPACRVELRSLGVGPGAEAGHFTSRCLPTMSREEVMEALSEQPVITINKDLLDSSYEGYKEALDTVIHEGRHVYQECNLYEREVHPSSGDLTNWRWNEFECSYQSYDSTYLGEKLYWMQPLEADARKFAEDVLSKFESKI